MMATNDFVNQEEEKDIKEREDKRRKQEISPEIFESEARKEIARLKRQNENLTELALRKTNDGHPEPPLDVGNQKGLGWRKRQQDKVRNYLLKGASFEWILWKIKRDTGAVTETARAIVEDAIQEEPENEPEGRPLKKEVEK